MKKTNLNNENNNVIRTMEDNIYEEIREIFYPLLAGEFVIYKEHAETYPCGIGLFAFLDHVKQNMPEIFKNKEFILDLICGMPKQWEIYASDVNILDGIYWGYLDEDLQKDRDVLLAFLSATRYGYEDPDYLEYGASTAGIPYDMFDLPHELIMDNTVFSMLLRKTDPVSIYTEILDEKEKLNPTILRKLLQWYGEHLYVSAYANDKIYKNMEQLQGLFVEAILDDYRDNETAEEIYDGLNPYVASFLSGLVIDFLDSIQLYSEYGREREWEKPVSEMLDLFITGIPQKLQKEIDSIPENAPEGKEDRIRAMEDFSWEESFRKVLSPYMEQIKLFDAAFEGDFSSLYEEEIKPEVPESSNGQQGNTGNTDNTANTGSAVNTAYGEFMSFPDDGNNLPF